MSRKLSVLVILTVAVVICMLPVAWAAVETAPVVQKNCMKCHQKFGKMENVIAGNMSNKSMEANSIQMKINNRLEMIKFTPETKISNVPDIKSLKNGMAMRAT